MGKRTGWGGAIVFYGCNENTHQGCDSVQLRVGFDRAEPMPLELLHSELGNDRFYAVHLDDEGDPCRTGEPGSHAPDVPQHVERGRKRSQPDEVHAGIPGAGQDGTRRADPPGRPARRPDPRIPPRRLTSPLTDPDPPVSGKQPRAPSAA